MGSEDKVFMKRFSGVLTVLVAITVVIIFVASFYEVEPDPVDNPSRLAIASERIAPVGTVRTEFDEQQEAVTEVPASVPTQMAQSEAPDGEAIYAQVCQACHMSGAAGAPVPGSDAWEERKKKGLETLTSNAINGIGVMPAKGGRTDLSDAEVKAAVEHMMNL